MYPGTHTHTTPEKAAAINAGTGDVLTYRELNDHSNQLGQLFYACGLLHGDHIALLMENNLRFFEVAWAAVQSGLYITALNRYLPPDEAAYIVNGRGARALVTFHAMREVAAALSPLIPACPIRLMTDGVVDGWDRYEAGLAANPANSWPRMLVTWKVTSPTRFDVTCANKPTSYSNGVPSLLLPPSVILSLW